MFKIDYNSIIVGWTEIPFIIPSTPLKAHNQTVEDSGSSPDTCTSTRNKSGKKSNHAHKIKTTRSIEKKGKKLNITYYL